MKESQKASKIFIVVIIFFFFLDRLTKELVKFIQPINFKFFSINYVTNTGSLFGLFKGNNFFFILLTLIVLFLIYYYRKDLLRDKVTAFFSGLIVAGAFGNFYDRLFYGAVIDFIDFYFWPVFNVADSCISVGVVALIILFLKK